MEAVVPHAVREGIGPSSFQAVAHHGFRDEFVACGGDNPPREDVRASVRVFILDGEDVGVPSRGEGLFVEH